MKISWFFLLVVLVLSSWLDVKTSSGSINVAGSASIQGPSVPSSSDGSVPVTGPSITGGGSVSIKCPSSPSVSDDSVCVEGGSTATSNSGSVTFNVGESTSMQLSSSSSSGPPVARGTGSDILFDNFDDSAAIDSFTGRPVSQDLQEAFQQSAVASLDSDAPTGSPMVGFTLMQGAAGKGAFCLDGSLPGYHFDKGSGSGETSWLVNLEISTTGTESGFATAMAHPLKAKVKICWVDGELNTAKLMPASGSVSMQISSSSNVGTPVVGRNMGDGMPFDEFDESAALDSFTGLPVMKAF
ncbi:hypothetical protein ACLOJK_015793 [Asimina triloba]